MSGTNDAGRKARERYCESWNDTMLTIWSDRIRLLGIIDTGKLLGSVVSMESLRFAHDDSYTEMQFHFEFLEYGIYQDVGTGREVARGNGGDIGRDKIREERPWMTVPFYRSFMNIREFMADNLGLGFAAIVSDGLDLRKRRD